MKTLPKFLVSGLLLSGLIALAHPAAALGSQKSNSRSNSPTSQGSLPKGKPFQYLNSRIDALQTQIDRLIGQVSTLEEWQASAEEALSTLMKNSTGNAEAIALLEAEIESIKSILATKQDIITGTCPPGQHVYEISASPATLLCSADLGSNGLAAFTVQVSTEIPAAESAVVAAECPDGSVPTGGSYEAALGLEVTSAGIADNGYEVAAANPTAGALTMNVTGTCLGLAP